MAAREYEVRGYRNTRYRAGVIDSSEFDRPLSQAVFESLYPDGDDDVVDLQEVGSRFLLRSIYKKHKIKVKHTGTQKDIIYQIDYLRIKAVNGGENREVAYYFVDADRTEFVGADTAVLYLTMDEQTTADATQYAKISGIIEKRNIHADETDLNWYPEEFNPADPMDTTIAYITAESGTGYTVTSGVSQTSGTLDLAVVYCDLGQALATPAVVALLPPAADSVTFTVEGSGSDFSVRVDGMALVDTNNATVKQALNKLRELGAEVMIGATFSFPLQCLKEAPTTYTSNGVPLITGIKGGAFAFTVDNLKVIPTYDGMYDQLVNKKAGYQHCTYTIVAPASGYSKTYTLHEIIESVSGADAENLPDKQVTFIGTGVPMANGAIYWRPSGLTHITPVEGYDGRIVFVESVRGSDWNSDGLMLKGQANAELLAQQLSDAKTRKEIDEDQIDKQLELTKQNIAQARFQSVYGLAGTGVGALIQGVSGNWGKAFESLLGALPELGKYFGANISSDNQYGIGLLGDTYDRQEKIAAEQAQLAKDSNALGLKSTMFGADYARRTQSLAIKPPTGVDMNRIMGSSLLVIRRTLTPADVMRYDNMLTWTGTTVKERYVGFLKDHDYLFEAGADFSYLKLGMCTLQLPGEPSGWANTTAWRSKIQAEMQTGGRYWKTKIMDYEWKMPIPVDEGFTPGGAGERVIYESLIADGTPTTTDLTIRINKDIPVEDIEFVVSGATYTSIAKTGFGEYTISIDKKSFANNDIVSVKLNADGISFNPKSRAVQVIKAWVPTIFGEVLSGDSSVIPDSLGYTIHSICEVSTNEHYILWIKDYSSTNCDIITMQVKDGYYYTLGSFGKQSHMFIYNAPPAICVVDGTPYVYTQASGYGNHINCLSSVVDGSLVHVIDGTYEIGRIHPIFYGAFNISSANDMKNEILLSGVRGAYQSGVKMTFEPSWPSFGYKFDGTNFITYSISPSQSGSNQVFSQLSTTPATGNNYNRATSSGLMFGTINGVTGLYKLLPALTLIDDSITACGAVFKDGLYVQDNLGAWYWCNNSGVLTSVPVLPPSAGTANSWKQYAVSAGKLYRVSGS